jgi:hypothetical protein
MTALASRPAAEWFEKLPTAAIGFASAAPRPGTAFGREELQTLCIRLQCGTVPANFLNVKKLFSLLRNRSENDDVWGLESLLK